MFVFSEVVHGCSSQGEKGQGDGSSQRWNESRRWKDSRRLKELRRWKESMR